MRKNAPTCLLAAGTLAALALAGCGGSSGKTTEQPSREVKPPPEATSLATTASAGTAKSVTASSKGVVASFTGGSHSPKVNQPWKFLITASRNGHAAKAEVTYEFAFNGQVVAKREHYVFVGKRADAITWPSSAVGYPLEFRAAISSEGASINLDYPVRVSP